MAASNGTELLLNALSNSNAGLVANSKGNGALLTFLLCSRIIIIILAVSVVLAYLGYLVIRWRNSGNWSPSSAAAAAAAAGDSKAVCLHVAASSAYSTALVAVSFWQRRMTIQPLPTDPMTIL